jgi:hypothetical protein
MLLPHDRGQLDVSLDFVPPHTTNNDVATIDPACHVELWGVLMTTSMILLDRPPPPLPWTPPPATHTLTLTVVGDGGAAGGGQDVHLHKRHCPLEGGGVCHAFWVRSLRAGKGQTSMVVAIVIVLLPTTGMPLRRFRVPSRLRCSRSTRVIAIVFSFLLAVVLVAVVDSKR